MTAEEKRKEIIKILKNEFVNTSYDDWEVGDYYKVEYNKNNIQFILTDEDVCQCFIIDDDGNKVFSHRETSNKRDDWGIAGKNLDIRLHKSLSLVGLKSLRKRKLDELNNG